MNLEQNLQHAWQFDAFVLSLKNGTVYDVHKGKSSRPRTASASASSLDMLLEQFTHSSQDSVTQCAHETRVNSKSIWHILKGAKWEVYIPRLLHTKQMILIEELFCEWFQHMVGEYEEFVRKIMWSDKVQFQLNATVNRHNYVHWHQKLLICIWTKQSIYWVSMSDVE